METKIRIYYGLNTRINNLDPDAFMIRIHPYNLNKKINNYLKIVNKLVQIIYP